MKMPKIITILVAFIVLHVKANDINEWKTWMLQFNKIYNDAEEESFRYSVWAENYKIIQKFNADEHSFTMGLNRFSDLTLDEFKDLMHLNPGPPSNNICELMNKMPNELNNKYDVPDAFDWRTKGVVSSVKDQGQCGSCWAFSAVGSLESAWALSTGQLIDLSEQQLVDCSNDEGNQGCEGGLMDQAFNYTIINGLCSNITYPYVAKEGTCRANTCDISVGMSRCVDIQMDNSKWERNETEKVMKFMVGLQQPLSVAVYAGNSFWMHYSGGVINDNECHPWLIDHAVVVVGYNTTDTGLDYWIVKNSWNSTWGNEGYVYIARGSNMCGIGMYPSYPII